MSGADRNYVFPEYGALFSRLAYLVNREWRICWRSREGVHFLGRTGRVVKGYLIRNGSLLVSISIALVRQLPKSGDVQLALALPRVQSFLLLVGLINMMPTEELGREICSQTRLEGTLEERSTRVC